MRAVHVVAGATLVTAALPAFGAVSPAHVSADPVAVDGSYALNGTYTAVSDGQWARKNESFRNDEATVTSTWIFTSTCPNPYACTGTVTSDQGWSAPAHSTAGMWYVSRWISKTASAIRTACKNDHSKSMGFRNVSK
jgi:hypothetical protein